MPLLLMLLACSDYNFGDLKDDPEGDDDDDEENAEEDVPEDDTGSPATDDTGPSACDLPPPAGGSVPILEACEGSIPVTIVDPWNLGVEWEFDNGGLGVIVMPAVGNLDDDDGDGDVDADDLPDIAFSEWSGGLMAISGDGSRVLFRTAGSYNGNAGVTIADVTGDGYPEVIALQTSGRVAAVNASGTVIWTSPTGAMAYYPQPTVADLDNDGTAEVIFDIYVIDGVTGAIEGTLGSSLSTSWRTPVVADLDMDGTREILLGNVVYAPNGSVLWTNAGSGAGNFAAVANIDADPQAEALFVSGSELLIYESDGRLIRRVRISGSNPGPPAVADFDGDGAVEIAIPANTTLSLYEMDGTRVWESRMQDNSGLAGCSGFDVNGDGAYEVLFADEEAFRLYDGRSGAVLYEGSDHDSQTLWEYPVIADMDGDGHAEIAVASNLYRGGQLGVTVYGHLGGGWPASGPTWGTHDFAVTNLGPDGSVPTGETPSWLVHNVFRARPSVDQPGAPDLKLEAGEVCVSGCRPSDEVELSYRVINQGALDASAATVSLYALVGPDEVWLAEQAVAPIAAGVAEVGGVFSLSSAAFAGARGYVMRLGGYSHAECDETNHELRVETPLCP